MRFMRDVILGFAIGVVAIIPGLSGGALAVTIGLYEPIIRAINRLSQEFRKNFLFLLPLALGGIIGVLALSNVMEQLMQYAQTK